MTSAESGQPYELVLSASARRKLQSDLPATVAFAVYEFITGPLLQNPYRVGKPLLSQFGPYVGRYGARRGEYRVIYLIDDDKHAVEVTRIDHRRDVYRPR